MGGSIGFGTPAATGAAIACPDRRVVCLEGDGSGMYTLQSLRTQARESREVTTVVFANRRYQILLDEFANVGAGNPGPSALSMLDIVRRSTGCRWRRATAFRGGASTRPRISLRRWMMPTMEADPSLLKSCCRPTT
jgi:thiamine pyrophosphate-dependent acetolactate synthase large subunit-like protein